jgi:hypothetical protein
MSMSGRLFNDMTLVEENTLIVGDEKSARGGVLQCAVAVDWKCCSFRFQIMLQTITRAVL